MAILPLIAPLTTLSSSGMTRWRQLGISGQSRVAYRKVVGCARSVGTRSGKLVAASALVALLSSLVPAEPIRARDLTPNPPGRGVVVTGSGQVLPVQDVFDDGFQVTTSCWNEGFVTSGKYIPAVDVVLDPGHGGSENGAVGPTGTSEKDLNLTVALLAAAELRERGYSVLLTRTTDMRIPVVVRAEIARALDPAVFVSIHHNGGARRRSTDPGTETYHQARNSNSVRLAGLLYEEIHGALSRYDIDWRDTVYQGANAIIRSRDRKDFYGILQYTPGMTSAITEAAYMDNPAGERLLANPVVQDAEADAIAEGIVRYLTTDDPGSGYNGTTTTSRRLYTGSPGGCVDPPLDGAPAGDLSTEGRYTDVLGGVHRPAIEEFAELGVLDGTDCGPWLFCPHAPILRWVMAVWLVRVLDGGEPEPLAAPRFEDVDSGRWWAPHVERLAALGITHGCGAQPARFCPYGTVTRAQMASFLVRAFDLAGGPPAGYVDTTDNPHAVNIDALTSAGVTHGCATNPARFCPHQATSRAQTATLLKRALDHTESPGVEDVEELSPPG